MTRFPHPARRPVHLAAGLLALLPLAFSGPGAAEETAPAVAVELNALDPVDGACRLVFVARNGLGSDITALVLETVAFDAEGGVSQIALFDFADLPAGRPRVRQFDIAGTSCEAVGSLLVNGVQTCEGAEACPLSVSSRTDVELLG
ncbi:hypothetical protein [Jannaschia marina]|uniref:hypothetical protein n=1 Tax=Jannaschia marina TaxID=2741674 RepID=UPI001F361746|nr:hypothetical protein [Jannaschia marina]